MFDFFLIILVTSQGKKIEFSSLSCCFHWFTSFHFCLKQLSGFFSSCSGSQVFVMLALTSLFSRMDVSAIEYLLSLCSCPPCHLASRCYFSVSQLVHKGLVFWPWRENAHSLPFVGFVSIILENSNLWLLLTLETFLKEKLRKWQHYKISSCWH